MPDPDTIVIKAPAGTKARWVHLAQKRGVKLSDWVINRIDHENNSATGVNDMTDNHQKYLAIWIRYYSKNEFGGTSVEAAAAYAAMDNMNQCKGWSQAEIDDDLAYWDKKVGG